MNIQMSTIQQARAKSKPTRTSKRNNQWVKNPFRNSPFGGNPSNVSRSMYTVAPLTITRYLKYETWVALNPTDSSPVAAYSTFNLSSLYDPEFTSAGHQPMGFDQMMGLYNDFVVTDARITLRTTGYNVADGDQQTSGVIGLTIDDTSTIGSTNTGVLMEYPNCSWSTVNANTIDKTLSRTISMSDYYLTDYSDLVGSGQYTGTANSSPTRCVYAQVWFGDPTSTATLSTLNLLVSIEYKCVFVRPIDLSAS